MTRIVILQPSYLPWVGAFEMLARSDIFVIYDDVQYDRDGWRARNRIKTANGTQWLTVPVHSTLGDSISTVTIASDKWQRKHIETVKQAYARAAYRDDVLRVLTPALERFGGEGASLLRLNCALFTILAQLGGLDTSKFVLASTLNIGGGQTERLVNICRHFGATSYLSGPAARDYLDRTQFALANIVVEWHKFVPIEYPQLHGEFVSHLSFLDLLLNCGTDSIRYLEVRDD